MPVKFIAGMILGAALSVGGVALLAQHQRAMRNPRIIGVMAAIKGARAYMEAVPGQR